MNAIRLASQLWVVIFALGCSRDGAESDAASGGTCSQDLNTVYLTAVSVEGGISLTQGGPSGGCLVPCDCDLSTDCGWEASVLPAEVGVYTEPETRCVQCLDTGYSENTGTIEIERIDDWGVVGCAIGTCDGNLGDFRFEAPWCVPE